MRLVFFFFLMYSNAKGAHQYDAAPMDLEGLLHYRREEKVDQVREWGSRCLCAWVLMIISAGKDGDWERVSVP